MTAIFYDLDNKLLACDSQASDLEGNPVILDAIKFGISDEFISVTAGNAEACDRFNELITSAKYQEAMEFLQQQTLDDLAPITVHIESGSYVNELSRGLGKQGCAIAYQGSGGDFLRHNYVTNNKDLDVAYGILVKDKYTYSGGLMRTYNFASGVNNMKEVDFKVAANGEKKGYHFPVGQKTFDAKWTNETKHKNVKSIKDLIKQ
ncbi:hypothetical protein ACS0KN_003418 [Vibrio cholerae]|uniref:hypothetical protein n=1 Tax=Vibrio cholerae TaxID=666 RepID=UPI001DA90679|nr:hypothetical protein [Vibrio cholerae]EJL6677328.1 hypothetical protein [Vibrio cholerae]EJL6759361.1 hypothetical protein [Vibrio cholerae]ELH0844895.1 hypothetical protein [Vibrio cholerae]